ncbi:P-loop containing nucleoside triphosphate hydrolase protein [Sordaria brevicollis]|uniref:P-loop containing nucleoside triphosphate hydrolase protein n=1 Tax=Sordaria brevicollis TaxID=83679 RepID=A0AAE0P1Z6_SORBR|nr:P-loop containing nucleoside triphosphate hydrolase protein [Sordaria brevicollis]
MVTRRDPRTDGMVLVMGVTGAGKSTFINTLKPGSVTVGHDLESTQAPPQAVQMFLDDEERLSVTVVDTPGFDDTWRSDAEILAEITEYLATQYALRIPLKGIIYLQPIYETRMKGSARKYFDMFRLLCGDQALKNVMLVTTRWDTVGQAPGQMGDALRREQELLDNWWKPMLKQGASAAQFKGTRGSAEAMVLELVRDRDEVVLDVQRELVDGHKEVGETTVGMPFMSELENDIVKWKRVLAKTDEDLAQARESERQLRSQGLRGDAMKDLTDHVRLLKDRRREAEKVVKQLETTQKKIQVRVGDKVRLQIGEKISSLGGRFDPVSTGITVFAAVLNITLTVVKFLVM